MITYFTGTTNGLALSQCWGIATGIVLGSPLAGIIEFFDDGVSIGSVVTDGVSDLVVTASDLFAPTPGVTIYTAHFTPEDPGQADEADSNPVSMTILAPIPFTDAFTRDDSAWSGPAFEEPDGFDTAILVGNAIRPAATNVYSKGVYYGIVGLNQYVEWDITLDPAQVGASTGLLRVDVAADSYYEGGFIINDGSSATAFIRSVVAGVAGVTDEEDTSVTVPVSGDTISFAAVEGQLVLKLNGVTILTAVAADGLTGDRAGYGVYALTDVADSEITEWTVRVGTDADAPATGAGGSHRIRYKLLHHGS